MNHRIHIASSPYYTPTMSVQDRRPSIAERRPSSVSNLSSRRPSVVIPPLEGIEKPMAQTKVDNLECDVLICGTGLQESILAAALSWQGSKVLHIDTNPYYGDHSATLTIDQIKNWFINSKLNKTGFKTYKNIKLDINENDYKIVSRDFGIDLSPKILFAKSEFLNLLIKSRVYHYLEFQSLSNFHTFENKSFGKLVSSKEDIFTSESLDLVMKRKLMKFLKFIIDDNSVKSLSRDDLVLPLKEYLQKNFKIDGKFNNELMYSLGLINTPQINALDGLSRIRRYLLSMNIYGNFPTLYSKYGGPGEISQGFCRSAAVAGTTYKLNTKLLNYDSKKKVANLSDGTHVKVNERVVSSLNQTINKPKNAKLYEIQRMVLIVDKPCDEWFAEGESSSIVVFPPGSLSSNNKYPVECLIMGSGTGCCPDGKCIWYIHTIAPIINNTAGNDLYCALKEMEESYIRESKFNIENCLDDDDIQVVDDKVTLTAQGSVKLSESLRNFENNLPNIKDKIGYILKLEFTQLTMVDQNDENNLWGFDDTVKISNDDVIVTDMPSSELSYDGIITEAKKIYKEIVGDDVDFFDVDFEDDEEEREIAATFENDDVLSDDVAVEEGDSMGNSETGVMDFEL